MACSVYDGLNSYRNSLILASAFFISGAAGQSLLKINCLQPFEIEFSEGMAESDTEKIISYINHDDHTFWYKLNTAENRNFTASFSSMDAQNNFDLFLYEYEGNNFCRAFIQNNLELMSFERTFEFKTARRSVYYLGVYPLFPGGCGHNFNFNYGGHKLALKVLNSERNCDLNKGSRQIASLAENEIARISGKVVDSRTGSGLNAVMTFIDPFQDHEVEVYSDAEDGYRAELRRDGDYKVKISSFGYEDKITSLAAYEGEKHNYGLNSSGLSKFTLNQVYFYPNTFALKEESREELKGIFSFLKNHPKVEIEIVGHTNGNKDIRAGKMISEKGEAWNFTGTARELSLKRALIIRDFLIEKGIDARKITAKGEGGDQMIIENPSNMKDAMKNIRVEIMVTSGQG